MLHRSHEIYDELCEVIPGGVNSPARAFMSIGMKPVVAESGKGEWLQDVDGNRYIDYCMSWGALAHGHAHPQITDAAYKRMQEGTSFGMTTDVEGKLARKIIQNMPSIEKIRFVSSGTEATMSAARLARGYTRRDIIVKFNGNFHGHADFFLVKAGSGVAYLPESSSTGIPADIVKNTISVQYNNVEETKKLLRDPNISIRVACVILEPVACNMGVVQSTPEFIAMLREETQRIGALLIFDEVISGFRVALGGAQSLYNVEPDITCVAKIIGGGFPAAGFGGSREIMDCLAPQGTVYQGGTLSGNPVAMVAGIQAIEMLETPGVYQELERKTKLITQPVKEFIAKKALNVCLQECGSMFTIFFGLKKVSCMEDAQKLDLKMFSHFFKYLLDNGVYAPPSQYEGWFLSTVHTDKNILKTRDLILDFLNRQ
jgi:glutamate-1-semialdehyde 2,1-aminomutase